MKKQDLNEVTRIVVYPYRRPGQRTDSWAIAVGDKPADVVHRVGSKAAAEAWALRLSDNVWSETGRRLMVEVSS